MSRVDRVRGVLYIPCVQEPLPQRRAEWKITREEEAGSSCAQKAKKLDVNGIVYGPGRLREQMLGVGSPLDAVSMFYYHWLIKELFWPVGGPSEASPSYLRSDPQTYYLSESVSSTSHVQPLTLQGDLPVYKAYAQRLSNQLQK